ncbi:MAG: hypothetical protein R6V55_08265, partial [Desulfovermiculus sp.]
ILHQGLEKYPHHLPIAKELAYLAQDKKDWPQTIRRFNELIQAYGRRAPADFYKRLSGAYRKVRDFDASEAVILQGREQHPRNIKLASEYAEIAMSRKQWSVAVQRWQEVLDVYGQDAGSRVYLKMSTAHRRNFDQEGAERTVEHGLAAYPADFELRMVHAELAMVRRDLKQAALRWKHVFSLGQLKPSSHQSSRFLQGRVGDWHLTEWSRLARHLLKDEQLFSKVADAGFCSCLGDILGGAGLVEDAEFFVLSCCRNYPECMNLAVQSADIAMQRKDWPEAVRRWHGVLATHGPDAPAKVYARLGLAYHLLQDHQAAQSIIAKGAQQHAHLEGLDAEYIKNDQVLAGWSNRDKSAHRLTFKMIRVDPESAWYDQIRCGMYLDSSEISTRIHHYFGDRMGAVDASRTGRFIWNLTQKLLWRYAHAYQRPPGLTAPALVDALVYPLLSELSHLVPLRHLARRIAREAGEEPVYIELPAYSMTYLNYWQYCQCEPLYLFAELERQGANVFLCLAEGRKGRHRGGNQEAIPINIRPGKKFSEKVFLECNARPTAKSGKALVPDGIRGINQVLDELGEVHVLTSNNIAPSWSYSTYRDSKPIDFTDSLYSQDTIPKEKRIQFQAKDSMYSQTVNGQKTANVIAQSSDQNRDLYVWLDDLCGEYLYSLACRALAFVSQNTIHELHMCDHLFIDSALLAHAVRMHNGKITLWPHSTSPGTYFFQSEKNLQQIHCMTRSAAQIWKRHFPNTPVHQKAQSMLPSRDHPRLKTNIHQARPQCLNVVIIAGILTLGRLPALPMKAHLQSCSQFIASLEQRLGDQVQVYVKRKRDDDDLLYLRNSQNELFAWKLALQHPMDLDMPNMIYISVSFGSSALFEGMSRGIPGMIVRDFPVEDYTLLDPEYVPTKSSPEITAEIEACLDSNYRLHLIERQMEYYQKETADNQLP